MGKMRSYRMQQTCRMVCVVGVLCVVMCGVSSCGWKDAKEVIATAEKMDKTEHVVYDDTAAIAGVIRKLDNPLGKLIHKNTLGKAYYYMGRNLSLSNHIAGAAECYIEADRLQIDDSVLRGRINSNMAYICAQSNNDSLALIFYNRAGRDFKKSGNEWRYAQNLLSVSECYVYLHQFATADSILKLAHTYALDSAYCERLMHIQGKYFYAKQEYDSALICLKRCEEYLSTNMDKSYLYIDIMRVYIKKNMVVHALPYALFIIENSTNPNLLKNAYYCLELVAEARNNTVLLSYYAHARNDIGKILYDEISKYDSATSVLGNYLLNPHPMRKGRIALIVSLCVCIIFAICLLIYMRRNRTAYDQIDTLISHVQKQAEDIQEKQRLLDFETNISNIIEKYNTPHKRWRKYSLLRRDLDVWLYNWFEALDALPLTEKEKIYCAVSLIYTHLTDVELSDFMCFAKESIRIFKYRMLKKIEVSSSDFPQFLHDLSN